MNWEIDQRIIVPYDVDESNRERHSLINRMKRRELLVKVNDAMSSSWALGWQVQQTGVINHGGHNRGFQCHAVASAASRSGFVIMTNGESGSELISKLLLGDLMGRFL